MCTFWIGFDDGTHDEVQNVVAATYVNSEKKTITIQESDLSKHLFPLKRSLWLQTKTGIHCISGDAVRIIVVDPEE